MANPVVIVGLKQRSHEDDSGAGVLAAARTTWQNGGVDFVEVRADSLELMQQLRGYRAALMVESAAPGESDDCITGALELARRFGYPMPRRIERLNLGGGVRGPDTLEAIRRLAAAMGDEASAIARARS